MKDEAPFRPNDIRVVLSALAIIAAMVALSGWLAFTISGNHNAAKDKRNSYLGKEAVVVNSHLIVKTLYWVNDTSTLVCRVDNGEKAMPRFTEVKFRSDELHFNFQEDGPRSTRAGTMPVE